METGKTKLLILLLFIVFIVSEAFLLDEFVQASKDNMSSIASRNINEKQIIISDYKTISQTYYEQIISNNAMLKLMNSAYTADTTKQAELRDQLYQMEFPTLRNMRNKDFHKLNFILPDGTIFLRVQDNTSFGDQADTEESIVSSVLNNKRMTQGFEQRQNLHNDYSFVYPLFFNGNFIGCIESGFSFISALDSANTLYDVSSFFMMDTDQANTGTDKNLIEKLAALPKTENYYVDDEGLFFAQLSSTENLILELFDKNNNEQIISKQLQENLSFEKTLKLNGTHYTYIFVELSSASGKHRGYLVFVSENTDLRTLVKNIWIKSILLLLLFVMILYIIISYNKFREQIEKLTYYDKLTGVYNRNLFYNFLEQQIHEFNRYNNPFSIIMFDIDKFKRINDNVGHIAGDLVLQQIATLTQTNLRKADYLIRFGGDEFIIILPEINLENAVIVAEKIRKIIFEDVQLHNIYKDVTISLGVTEYKKGENAEQLIDRTDSAMYRAKGKGRNQIGFDLI